MYSSHSLESYSYSAYRSAARLNSQYPKREFCPSPQRPSAAPQFQIPKTERCRVEPGSLVEECESILKQLTNPTLSEIEKSHLFNQTLKKLNTLTETASFKTLPREERIKTIKILIDALYYSELMSIGDLSTTLFKVPSFEVFAVTQLFKTHSRALDLRSPRICLNYISEVLDVPTQTFIPQAVFRMLAYDLNRPLHKPNPTQTSSTAVQIT